ncbi:hypothetical protein Emin_0173 [Elusimicrobium minutum Pei191]|uniref:Uncharacterized protein n=1 Tax=Elusimicrobium minutum (strain Pei191) TaxID=445932 RepID=B2KBQ0_ELUMP|nr:hypothetical protein [Elusimicrobium minutum]ACC97737.1 hypothetical protein Emin_0173 [Elusimicrobium minutum Pei191]
MQNINYFFENTETKLETMRKEISAAGKQLYSFVPRLESLSAQVKKGIHTRDESLEKEFNITAKTIYDLANTSEEFWAKTREELRNLSKKEITEVYSLEVKTVNLKSRTLAKTIDEFQSAFGYVYPTAKDSSLKLNLWMIETATLTLDKLANKILFMARELSKILEAKKTIY